MCQCKFINCNIRTTLTGMLIMEHAVEGKGEKSLYFLLNFPVNLKLL